MGFRRSLLGMAVVGLLVSCTDATDPVAVDSSDLGISADGGDGLYTARGQGIYLLPVGGGVEVETRFKMKSRQSAQDGTAYGTFRHRLVLGGELIDFTGEVTCMTVDSENGRAWIGGVVTRNRSTREPQASGEIFQEGRDIWFRVLDLGPNRNHQDRTTFVGFEGGGGIITSQEYCDTQDWPDDNARTNPFAKGGVTLGV